MHGRDVSRVALHQGGGQLALQHQLLRAVGVGHDAFEQLHALKHPGLDLLPIGLGHHERKQVQRPGSLRLVGRGIHVVGDAVVAHLALQVRHAGAQTSQAFVVQALDERLPRRTEGRVSGCVGGPAQFIPVPFGRSCSLLRPVFQGWRCRWGDGVGRRRGHANIVAQALRKSRVYGNSALACSVVLGPSAASGFIAPGVWPMRKKRAMRRLSAS